MGKKDVGRIVTSLLRHCPQKYDLKLDKAGYCNIDELISALNKHGYKTDKAMIEEIGKNERFSFNKNHTKIRADYGNSIGLKLRDMYNLPSKPSEILYHGTHLDVIDSIKKSGIVRYPQLQKARDHIFLTDSIEVAIKKGFRFGDSVVLPIKALEMYETGKFEFYHAKSDIWLIETSIPPEFIDFANIIINSKPY